MKDLETVIAETFNVRESDVTDSMEMKSVDLWDSLTHMELIANLECEYDIEFTADEIMEMITVEKIRKILGAKINGN